MNEAIKNPAVEIEKLRRRLRREKRARLEAERLSEAKSFELYEANRELIRARDRASAAAEARTLFLANISHELRTPLTAVLGFADMLLEQEDAENEGARREKLRSIKRNGEQLLSLVDDLLEIQGGPSTPRLQIIEPVALVREVIASVAGPRGPGDADIRLELDGEPPARMWSDPERIKAILRGVIDNAVKFSRGGPTRVRLRAGAPGRGGKPPLEMEIIDEGVGMSAELQERAFEPFFQADPTSAREFGGAGRGLFVSRALARSLGGDVRIVESRVGAGTRVMVTIVSRDPRNGAASENSPARRVITRALPVPSPDAPHPLAGWRLLLVEDGEDNRVLLAHLLRKAGAEVTTVENGRLALEAITTVANSGAGEFDVVLMDMQMPVLDGYRATASLRERGYAAPIMALTAHATVEDRRLCLEAGCDDYLTKPCDRAELVRRILNFAAADPA